MASVRKKVTRFSPANEWSPNNAIKVKRLIATAQPEYVAWIDLMGAQGWMAGSIRRAAEIIGIIHVAGLRANARHEVKAYPVIDGIYLVGNEKREFKAATKEVMHALAVAFLARKPADRFLVRGGIAYGRVLHGADVARLHPDLKSEPKYSRCLAIGIAIGQAYAAEKKAPPFGFYVDMTARSTASVDESPYLSSFYRWWGSSEEEDVRDNFGVKLDEHFKYLKGKHREIEYEFKRLEEHWALAREYFQLAEDSTAETNA